MRKQKLLTAGKRLGNMVTANLSEAEKACRENGGISHSIQVSLHEISHLQLSTLISFRVV